MPKYSSFWLKLVKFCPNDAKNPQITQKYAFCIELKISLFFFFEYVPITIVPAYSKILLMNEIQLFWGRWELEITLVVRLRLNIGIDPGWEVRLNTFIPNHF